MQTSQIYSFIHNITNQKNISEELHRTFNSYLGVLYAASTPPVNIDTASVLLYTDGFKEAHNVHKINQNSFEIIMQYFDSDFYKIFRKHYRARRGQVPDDDIHRFMKAKFIEFGPTLK
jgi:hypothetical protein